MADDFNHWLPQIGYDDQAITPNLDKLAKKGVLFANAQSPSPVCNPSRNAIFSGLRPATTGIVSNGDGYVREKSGLENIISMHQHYFENGYFTYGAGKLWHPGKMGGPHTDPENWTDLYRLGTGSRGGKHKRYDSGHKGYQWSGGKFDLHEEAADTKMADHIAELLNILDSGEQPQPFFIGVGFFRPHLPWNCHKQFWDLYDEDKLHIPKGYKENDLDDIARKPNNVAMHDVFLKDGKWLEGVHAYLANLSYADYNVGIVLDALERTSFVDDTIVLFMGDHGWHLGEKNRWSKHEVFEQANHTTLIVYDPSSKGNGVSCLKPVSLQDLYPTLIELCGLPENAMVQGNDLSPLLNRPASEEWDQPVLMTYRGTHYIKTNKWKYIPEGDAGQLYDVENDPNEWNNLWNDPAYDEIKTRLQILIDQELENCRNLRKKISQS